MIAYYAMTKFHLIFSATHKLTRHKKEGAVLFLYSGMQDLETNYQRLSETRIFREIYIVPEIELRSGWKPLNAESSREEIEENVKCLVCAVEEWLPVPVRRGDTLYIANDHWALGTYCIYKKIPYVYYEDGVGMLSKPEYSYQLVCRLNVTHGIVARYLNAFGENEYAVKKLADLKEQSEGFFDGRAEHFSLKEELARLKDRERKQLLYIFDAPHYEIQERGTLLLTEHFVNMKRLSLEGQRELYTLLADFFAVGKLYIKPHPNDFQIDYRELFPDGEVIGGKFPSELLPYCFSGHLELGLAACSTSVLGLKDMLKRTLRFAIDIENHYSKLFVYWAFTEILKRGERAGLAGCFSLGAQKDLLEGFGIFCGEEDRENTLLLVDRERVECERLRGRSAVFLNPASFFLLDGELEEKFLVLLRVKKTPSGKKQFSSEREENIWIYTENQEFQESLRRMEVKREMKYTGLQLDIEAVTEDREMQVKILQGNLAAAIERLEKYQDSERALLREIEDLKKRMQNRDQEILKSIEAILKEERQGEKQ